jgi:hypothetical protein
MILELKCPCCGSTDIVLDELETGEEIYYCTNPDCDEFKSFDFTKDLKLRDIVKEGVIKEIIFDWENDEGKTIKVKDKIENGILVSEERIG